MGQFIEALYEGEIIGKVDNILEKPKMRELHSKAFSTHKELLRSLNQEQKALFEKYYEITCEIENLSQYYSFEKGFKLGSLLQNELL